MKLAIHNGAKVFGGNEKWLATLAEGLSGRGHDVRVSCRPHSAVAERLAARGIRTVTARPGGALDLPRALFFAEWLRSWQPDVLLLTSWNRTFWAAWAARQAGVPRVVVRLGIVRSLPRFEPVAYAFRRYVDAVIVNSVNIRSALLESAPWFPPASVHVVLNGIVVPAIDRAAARASLYGALALAPDTKTVALAGHLAYRKGVDILLNALTRVDWHGVVIGDGPARSDLQQLAQSLGVRGRVSWLGHRQDVPQLIAGCDAFAMVSRNEGMANVMLEAMSVGTPVIAADIAGVREALGEAGGWIIAPESPGALAAALAEVAGAAATQRTERAIERLRTRFSVTRMVEEAEAVLRG